MKTQTQTLFNKISDQGTGNQPNQVEETVVKGCSNIQSKTFSSVDMWNIQRQRKTIVIR